MKKLLLVSAAMLVATPAFAANNDSDNVTINASVAKECSVEDLGSITIGDIPIIETPGSNALQINGEIVKDSSTIWISCNFTNQMTLSTPAPLTSASASTLTPMTGSQPFTNQIHYRFQAWNYGLSPQADSLNNPVRVGNGAPLHKQILFKAKVNAADNVGARPYAATDYTATATIAITTV